MTPGLPRVPSSAWSGWMLNAPGHLPPKSISKLSAMRPPDPGQQEKSLCTELPAASALLTSAEGLEESNSSDSRRYRPGGSQARGNLPEPWY